MTTARAAAVSFGQAWFAGCAVVIVAGVALDSWIQKYWRGR